MLVRPVVRLFVATGGAFLALDTYATFPAGFFHHWSQNFSVRDIHARTTAQETAAGRFGRAKMGEYETLKQRKAG